VIDLTRYDEVIRQRREILKAHDYDAIPEDGWWEPHQRKGIAAPPLEKPFSAGSPLVDLPRPEEATIGRMPLSDVIAARRSRRRFEHEPLTLEELSFLLWSTQGVRTVDKNEVWTLRNVPSGGARQPFETYLLVRNVENLVPGVYRYLPLEHKVIQVAEAGETFEKRIVEACNGQSFAGKSAVVFVWATIPRVSIFHANRLEQEHVPSPTTIKGRWIHSSKLMERTNSQSTWLRWAGRKACRKGPRKLG
jgi:hypothetical protein